MQILLLCTANQCRSPMAQVLLVQHLARRGLTAGVESAGFRAAGRPAAPHACTVMEDRGLTLSGHVSRTATASMLRGADLVLTMERRHVPSAVSLEHACWPVCFSLGELLVRASAAGPRADGQSLPEWLAAVHAERRPSDLVRDTGTGDVADPIGRPLRSFRETARRLDVALGRLVDLAAPRAVAEPPRAQPRRRSRLAGRHGTLHRR